MKRSSLWGKGGAVGAEAVIHGERRHRSVGQQISSSGEAGMHPIRFLLVVNLIVICGAFDMNPSWAGTPARGAGAAVVTAAPEEGGPRNWEVTRVSRALILRERPSTGAGAVARFAPGTILDKLGSRKTEGRVWCDVQPLGG